MNLAEPATSVLPGIRARILTALARTEAGLTGRGLAAVAGTSVSSTARDLERLVTGGVVYRVQIGSAQLFRLNRDHLAVAAVLDLASIRERLLTKLSAALGNFASPPVTAVLFGSAARGDGDEDSDVDLLLVRPDGTADDDPEWAADVTGLAERVRAWTGNQANVLDYDESELRDLFASGSGFAREVRRDGILLHGRPLPFVRRVAAR